jgi:hypothetical protein
VTTKLRIWLVPALFVLAVALFVGFIIIILGKFTGEYWCADRNPPWGPPEDPNSTCSGLSWARDHPGEFPWTLPR